MDWKTFLSESDTGFFLSVLRNFWEHFFYRTLPGDCFWWIGLMVKNFNSVSLIFLNSQPHTPPGEMTLFWCNKKHFLMKKTWLNSESQTLSLTLFQRQSRRGVQSRVHNFLKTYRKVLVWESLGRHLFLIKLLSKLYFGYFYKLFQAAALQ